MRYAVAVLASAAMAVLAACSSGGSAGAGAGLPGPRGEARWPKTAGLIYVDDIGAGDVKIFESRTWKEIGTIVDDVGAARRNWVDAAGNLYVTSDGNTAIAEFTPGATSPSVVYTDGLEEPVDVATDSAGNVYGADDALGAVDEYPQGSNKVIASCSIPGADPVESLAVDGKGDVFVAYNEFVTSGNDGHILEFRGGLGGCHATPLISIHDLVSGMTLDKANDLVVCIGAAVRVIEPPYTRISRRIGSGYRIPISVRIKSTDDQAYIADAGLNEIVVLKYPQGTVVKRLGSQQGIVFVAGAVDSQNFSL